MKAAGPGQMKTPGGERIAVLRGLRTPFASRSRSFEEMGAADLGALVVRELMARAELYPNQVELVVFGQTGSTVDGGNMGREIALLAGIPKEVQAFSVNRACASSIQAITSAAEAMLAGQATVAIVGGAGSAGDCAIAFSGPLRRALMAARRAKSAGEVLRQFGKLRPKDILPSVTPRRGSIPARSLVAHVERMAREIGINREQQDAYAHRSHASAAEAWATGLLEDEVMHVVPPPTFDNPILQDDAFRRDSALETYSRMTPEYDPIHGTVTAGNASPLGDGASALILMTESKAKALGHKPLGYLRAWAYAGLDPNAWMLGPAYAVPRALDAAGVKLKDVEALEMHEACAAQVLGNVAVFCSKKFAQERLGRGQAMGEVDMARFNVKGGSIATGHVGAATGARMVNSVLFELRRRGGGIGLATTCASGGIGAALVVEGVS